MTAVQFAYWLQGFFELKSCVIQDKAMTHEQVDCIQKHLALVFKHEIDPSYGPEAVQKVLNEIHNPPKQQPNGFPRQPKDPFPNDSPLIKC